MIKAKTAVFIIVVSASAALTAGLTFYKIAIGNAYRVFYELPDVEPPPSFVQSPQAIARADWLQTVVGCRDCHGTDGLGQVLSDGAQGVVLTAPALFGNGGRVSSMTDGQLWRVLRLGVDSERRALWAMPRDALLATKQDDLVGLVASLRRTATSKRNETPNSMPTSHLTSWGYVQIALRNLWLIERQSPNDAMATQHWDEPVPTNASIARGHYLASVGRCVQCHQVASSIKRVNLTFIPDGPALARTVNPSGTDDEFAKRWAGSGCQTDGKNWGDKALVVRATLFSSEEQRDLRGALLGLLEQ